MRTNQTVIRLGCDNLSQPNLMFLQTRPDGFDVLHFGWIYPPP